jgi:hypothetical protein
MLLVRYWYIITTRKKFINNYLPVAEAEKSEYENREEGETILPVSLENTKLQQAIYYQSR